MESKKDLHWKNDTFKRKYNLQICNYGRFFRNFSFFQSLPNIKQSTKRKVVLSPNKKKPYKSEYTYKSEYLFNKLSK